MGEIRYSWVNLADLRRGISNLGRLTLVLPPKFCSACGAPLNPEARFCGQCGQSLPAAPIFSPQAPAVPQPPLPQPAAIQEPVLGVIPYASQKKGLFKSITYNLVITPQRIIFATLTDQMMKDEAQNAAEQAKNQGKGFLARTAAVWGSRTGFWQKYLTMPVEQILSQHPDNTYIPHSQIKSARIHMGDIEDNSPDVLRIDSIAGKMNLELRNTNTNDARKLLKQVLGNRMR